MAAALDKIQQAIEDEARAWAQDFVATRKAFLQKRKIQATGDLQDSIQSQVVNQASSGIVELLVEFEQHGRFLDMKNLKPSKGGDSYIIALENWLKTKGFFSKFRAKYDAKYEANRKFSRITSGATREARALNRMAWGIAVNRSNGKYRRRRWYNKPKTAAIAQLFNSIAANLPTIAAEEIAKQFK